MKQPICIDLIKMRANLDRMIKSDRNNPMLRGKTIWYEWNMRNNCIHALDTDAQRQDQLNNYKRMGFEIVDRIPHKLGKLDCIKIILRKDPNFMPTYGMWSNLADAFALSQGYLKAQYEHFIIEVPGK